jgi:hypothetical protein
MTLTLGHVLIIFKGNLIIRIYIYISLCYGIRPTDLILGLRIQEKDNC